MSDGGWQVGEMSVGRRGVTDGWIVDEISMRCRDVKRSLLDDVANCLLNIL